ncbi:hypothetical protein NDU88_004976 [Pleurodeles waltl]|uniref:Uncharacterized protein n=1 Tax=Pleurodeles waltl TaxID=8319 RepID=A0AAV7LJQ8_PLEWA|nr:hypothetical protein NDU88_004976 [Pleurodeles waltl]
MSSNSSGPEEVLQNQCIRAGTDAVQQRVASLVGPLHVSFITETVPELLVPSTVPQESVAKDTGALSSLFHLPPVGASQALESKPEKAKDHPLFVKGGADFVALELTQPITSKADSLEFDSILCPCVLQTQLQDQIAQDCSSSVKLPDQQAQQQQVSTNEQVIMQQDTKNMLNMILDEIRGLNASYAAKVAAVCARLAKIEQAMTQLPERLKDAEARVLQLEDHNVSTQKLVSQLQKQKIYLEAKLEEMENHSCHSNLQIVGVPEGCEAQ